MNPLLAEDTAVANEIFKYVAGGEAVAIVALSVTVWKLVMMGRNDIIALIPVLKENNELLKDVKEFLK